MVYKYNKPRKRSTRTTDDSSFQSQSVQPFALSKTKKCSPSEFKKLKDKHKVVSLEYLKYVNKIDPLQESFTKNNKKLKRSVVEQHNYDLKKSQLLTLIREKTKVYKTLEGISEKIQGCLLYNLIERKRKEDDVLERKREPNATKRVKRVSGNKDIPEKFIDVRKQLRLLNSTNYTLAAEEYIEELEDIVSSNTLNAEKLLVKQFLAFHSKK